MIEKEPKFTRDLPEARQRQLIEATARCLARYGPDGTTVRVVAGEAGVSPGLVRHHFDGMHDLIAQTYRWTGKEMQKALRIALSKAPQNPEAQLRAFVDANFTSPVLDPDLLTVWLTFWSLTRTDRVIKDIHRKVYAEYVGYLQQHISAIAQEHQLKIDEHLAALTLTALLDGLWVEHCLDSTMLTAADARHVAHDWIDNLKTGGFMAKAAKE